MILVTPEIVLIDALQLYLLMMGMGISTGLVWSLFFGVIRS